MENSQAQTLHATLAFLPHQLLELILSILFKGEKYAVTILKYCFGTGTSISYGNFSITLMP